MNKSALKALLINAKSVGARYIGMRLTQTGIKKPEFHITQRENFDKMFEYFMKMYDDDLISLTNREIKITGIAQGNTFEDIEVQLCEMGFGWKQPISDAIEKSYNNMISETPPASEEERLRCEAMKEAVKGMFLNESRTAAEARFIFDNLEKYEELFDVCMNGDDMEFKRGLIELQRLQNEYILREEKDE